MKIPAHTITLEVQTTLSPEGLRVMAEELAKLAETVPSASHALTYRSMAAAFVDEAEFAEYEAAAAEAEHAADVDDDEWSRCFMPGTFREE